MASDDLNKFIEAEYEQKAGGEEDIVLRYDSNGFGTKVDKSFFEYVTSFASNTADLLPAIPLISSPNLSSPGT